MLDARGLRPEDFCSVDDLAKLPLLDRPTLRASFERRTANGPAGAGHHEDHERQLRAIPSRSDTTPSRGTGATRSAGAATAGAATTSAMRALHYWGYVPQAGGTWWKRKKIDVDRLVKRDLFIDCTPRSEQALMEVVAAIRRFKPHVIVAYASGAGALARSSIDKKLRTWDNIPVLTGAEGLLSARSRSGDRRRSARRSTPTAAAR